MISIYRIQTIFTAVFVLAFAGPRAVSAVEVIDRVIAVVNTDVITLSELRELAVSMNEDPDDAEMTNRILDQLIEQKILVQEGKKLGTTVTEADVDLAIEDVKLRYKLTDEQLTESLKKEKVTMDAFRYQWKSQLLNQRIMSKLIGGTIAVTEEEIIEEYEKKHGPVSGDVETRISHILIITALDIEDPAALASEVSELARKGKNFGKLAKQYSKDTASAEKGGDLGYFKKGELVDVLEEAISKSKKGDIVGPVRSNAGYHIIKVTDRRKSGEVVMDEFYKEQIREQIYKDKVAETLDTWLEDVKKAAYIEKRL